MNVLVKARYLFTMEGPGLGVVEDGAVYSEDDRIVAVGPWDEVSGVASKDDYYLDYSGYGLVMPGFVDMHMHTGLAILRGFACDVPEIQWMSQCLSPLASAFDRDVYTFSRFYGVLDGLLSGTIYFGEYGRDIDGFVREVAYPLGVKVLGAELINTVSQPLYKIGDSLYPLDTESGYRQLDEAEKLVKRYRDDPRVKIFFGPQALDMVPLEVIKRSFELAEAYDTYIHMHVAQGGRERRQIRMRYGGSTVEILHREGLLNNRLLAAHMHDASDDELRLAASKGVVHIACSRSIANIDGIIPPFAKYLSLGGKSFIGTDQIPCVGNHNMLQEVRFTSILAKLQARDPSGYPPYKILRHASIEPLKALGIEDAGILREGFKADYIVLDLSRLWSRPQPRLYRNIASIILYSLMGDEVRHVIIDGEPKIVDGKPIGKNLNTIAEKAEEHLTKILIRAGRDLEKTECQHIKRIKEKLE